MVRQLLDKLIARENEIMDMLPKFSPRVETYLQMVKSHKELGLFPSKDKYYLGRMTFETKVKGNQKATPSSFLKENSTYKVPRFLARSISGPFKHKLRMNSLVRAVFVDPRGLDHKKYQFNFVRREFLGEVRCLVFNVVPKPKSGRGLFKGRIWVEDRDHTIVRFKGVRVNPPKFYKYIHFDSWRKNIKPGLWVPAFIYFEETDIDLHAPLSIIPKSKHLRAQARFWGYQQSIENPMQKLTQILVEEDASINDPYSFGQTLSPLSSQRTWEMEAENNVIEALERAGLVAQKGEFEKVLDTVVNNLIVTNQLEGMPPVRSRVMLTLPLESFAIGRSILVSRGLIDVLPNEDTLATILAHELAHLVLGHHKDNRYAFYERLMIPDEDIIKTLKFNRSSNEEAAADVKAFELLKNSPYKDGLRSAGLFMRSMDDHAKNLKSLFGSHLGDRLSNSSERHLLMELKRNAPKLQHRKVNQIPAYPLSSRLEVDTWSGKVSLKDTPPAPYYSREKMQFLVTPLFLQLRRIEFKSGKKVAEKKHKVPKRKK